MVGNATKKPSNKKVDALTEEEAKRQLRKRRAEAHAKGVYLSRIRMEVQTSGKQGSKTALSEVRRHLENAEQNNLMSRVFTDEQPEYEL